MMITSSLLHPREQYLKETLLASIFLVPPPEHEKPKKKCDAGPKLVCWPPQNMRAVLFYCHFAEASRKRVLYGILLRRTFSRVKKSTNSACGAVPTVLHKL